jgi:hypothetical protein
MQTPVHQLPSLVFIPSSHGDHFEVLISFWTPNHYLLFTLLLEVELGAAELGGGFRETGLAEAKGPIIRLPFPRATAGDCLESSYFKEKPLREFPDPWALLFGGLASIPFCLC